MALNDEAFLSKAAATGRTYVLAVQHERGPRNTTLRRQQMAHFLQDPRMLTPSTGALRLVIPRRVSSEVGDQRVSITSATSVLCNTPPHLPRVSQLCSQLFSFSR